MVKLYCPTCKKKTKTENQILRKSKADKYILKGKCFNCNTNKSALVPIVPQGEGIVDFIKNVVRAFKGPRTDKMPPSARATFDKYKDKQIARIDIGRTPLNPIIKGVVNLIKSKPFDELYHLFSIIQTTDGDKLLLEKNQVINFRELKNDDIKENTETETVAVNKEIKINELFENAQKSMGEKFYTYSALQNNCQDFLLGLLKSSGLGNQQNYEFIKQDVKDLVPTFWENIGKKLTDLAGSINIIQEGEGGSEIHAIEFKKDVYKLKDAKKWMKDHERPIKVIHKKENTLWFNQTPKTRYKSFIKKPIEEGINLVIGFK